MDRESKEIALYNNILLLIDKALNIYNDGPTKSIKLLLETKYIDIEDIANEVFVRAIRADRHMESENKEPESDRTIVNVIMNTIESIITNYIKEHTWYEIPESLPVASILSTISDNDRILDFDVIAGKNNEKDVWRILSNYSYFKPIADGIISKCRYDINKNLIRNTIGKSDAMMLHRVLDY